MDEFADRHAEWIAAALARRDHNRGGEWLSSVAVGSHQFVEGIQHALNSRANGRRLECFSAADAGFVLREPSAIYSPHFAAEKRR